jgi:DnaB-like helicase N terminal domain/AAA domain
MTQPFSPESLPQDIEAEKSILGAVLRNNRNIEQVESYLTVDDFFLDSNRIIFGAMLNLSSNGMGIDRVTLAAHLEQGGYFEQIGGATYIESLIDGVTQTDTIEPYARIVRHKAKLRRVVTVASDVISRVAEGHDDLETVLSELEEVIATTDEGSTGMTGCYYSLDELFEADIQEPEEIIYGVHRGEVAGLMAITNFGKSTLLFNVSLSLAAGEGYWPLAPRDSSPRRILYIDCESPVSRLQADLQKMHLNVSNAETARANYLTVVDAEVDGEPLNLSKPHHYKTILWEAKKNRADLIIIDTAASAFELMDENANAEVTRRLMNPLKRLAREANCGVVFTHHIGKATETQTRESAYLGRGASAFGALSRTIFTLERDAKKGPGYIVLKCAKIKGEPFAPVLLKLNAETRWFEVCAERPEAKLEAPTAQEIESFVRGQESTTSQICSHFKVRASERTVKDRIDEAERLKLIEKSSRKSRWRSCNGQHSDFPDTAISLAMEEDAGFVQSATPIGNARTHEFQS